jgi:hypothetical protein
VLRPQVQQVAIPGLTAAVLLPLRSEPRVERAQTGQLVARAVPRQVALGRPKILAATAVRVPTSTPAVPVAAAPVDRAEREKPGDLRPATLDRAAVEPRAGALRPEVTAPELQVALAVRPKTGRPAVKAA